VKDLAGLLGSQLVKLHHHVRKFEEFVRALDTPRHRREHLGQLRRHLMALRSAGSLLNRHFDEGNVKIVRHVLTSFFVSSGSSLNVPYEETDGVAMGSSPSPVIASFYVEAFEEVAV
jgi:hypothetical protein